MSLGTASLYTNPQLEVAVASGTVFEVAVVGFVVDARYETVGHLAAAVARHESLEQVLATTRPLSGRFCIFVSTVSEIYALNDASSLRSLFYKEEGDGIAAASDPALLRAVGLVGAPTRKAEFVASSYASRVKEHYLPSGTSLTPGVARLTPNHYVNLSSGEQTRFWPTAPRGRSSPEEAVRLVSTWIAEDVARACHLYSCNLPLTAGIDSRLILAACNGVPRPAIDTYTLQYRRLNSWSPDVRIARRLAKASGRVHRLIDCREDPPAEFVSAYTDNTEIAHVDDWATIAFGIQQGLPRRNIALKGNCVEIARCFFYKDGAHAQVSTIDQILDLKPGWAEIPFLVTALERWYSGAKATCDQSGYDILDLFYWEHQMGSWQAQSQSEWDIAQECFTPFSSRRILEALLATSASDRCAPNYTIFRQIIETLDPALLDIPVNPPSRTSQVRSLARRIVRRS